MSRKVSLTIMRIEYGAIIRRRTWCNLNFTFRAMSREWIPLSSHLASLPPPLILPLSFGASFSDESFRDEETLQAFRFSNRGLGSAPPGFLCLMPYCDLLTPLHCCHAPRREELGPRRVCSRGFNQPKLNETGFINRLLSQKFVSRAVTRR